MSSIPLNNIIDLTDKETYEAIKSVLNDDQLEWLSGVLQKRFGIRMMNSFITLTNLPKTNVIEIISQLSSVRLIFLADLTPVFMKLTT